MYTIKLLLFSSIFTFSVSFHNPVFGSSLEGNNRISQNNGFKGSEEAFLSKLMDAKTRQLELKKEIVDKEKGSHYSVSLTFEKRCMDNDVLFSLNSYDTDIIAKNRSLGGTCKIPKNRFSLTLFGSSKTSVRFKCENMTPRKTFFHLELDYLSGGESIKTLNSPSRGFVLLSNENKFFDYIFNWNDKVQAEKVDDVDVSLNIDHVESDDCVIL